MKRTIPLLASLVLFAALANPLPSADELPTVRARMGYTRTLVRNVNENDFRTAMRAYSKVIAESFRIITDTDQAIFDTGAQLEQALRRGTTEVVSGGAEEILSLDPALFEPPFFSSLSSGQIGRHYVLAVHVQSNLTQIADLNGCRVAVLDSVEGNLARHWLEVACAQASLPPLPTALRELRLVSKASQAVLPVFFRQIDACVTTQESLAALSALNPQISRQLRIIAVSPRVVPVLTALRRGIEPALRDRIRQAITSVDSLPAGRQVLILFQTERVEAVDDAALDATRQLLAAHARLAIPAPPPLALSSRRPIRLPHE